MDAPSDDQRERLEELISSAVAKGLREAFSDPQVWEVGVRGLQRKAAQATGNWLLDILMGVFKKALTFFVILGVVYAWGGWGALTKVLALIFSRP